jgi:hypothetical protein
MQVQGGGVAIVVGAHVWNSQSSFGESIADAGRTILSGLSSTFNNCSFFGSKASTKTSAMYLCFPHFFPRACTASRILF